MVRDMAKRYSIPRQAPVLSEVREKQLCQDMVHQDQWKDLAPKRGKNTARDQQLARK
jgi:hypothetical protein